jgi:uncharacterized metal-binding protein YceD (DUF177 family)
MSSHPVSNARPEFSIPLAAADVPQNGTHILFEANDAERAALAKRFDLLELSSFKGKVAIKPWRRHGLSLEGRFTAEVVQACVATLEPITSQLSQNFTLHFLPADMIDHDAAAAAASEIIVDVQSEDPPEPIENGQVDVGEAMSEQLAVSIDPYPKKPGATFETIVDATAEEGDKPANPFAALEKLKKKD